MANGNGSYCLDDRAPPRLPSSVAENTLNEVVDPGARRAVEDAIRRWNPVLRESVRAATALRFTSEAGRTVASVPVSVVDGIPKPLADATGDVEPWQWWLVLNGPELETARKGLGIVGSEREMLARYLGDVSGPLAAVDSSLAFIGRILDHSMEKTLAERLEEIEDDILGAYWVRDSKIQIYWMPIAIFAALFGLGIPVLTVITLCHELAHAYTHRGVDLNGKAWDTARFVGADNRIKEGLAQYYTERVLHGLDLRLPGVLAGFLDLAERQSALYNDYQNWIGDREDASLEAVRYAMLELRNADAPACGYDGFVEQIREAHGVLGGAVRSPEPQKSLF